MANMLTEVQKVFFVIDTSPTCRRNPSGQPAASSLTGMPAK